MHRKACARRRLVLLLGLVCPLIACAAEEIRFQQLMSFQSGSNDAASPLGPLLEGSDGALYGTTTSNVVGTVFRLNRDGNGFAVLHFFGGAAAHDGEKPWHAGVIEASDGMLYGTTVFGGNYSNGTTFRMNKDGSDYSVLHHFTGGLDGRWPSGGLLEASDGFLYGITQNGGASMYSGTLYRIGKSGDNFRVMHQFNPYTSVDGGGPVCSLIEASDGFLYGTTVVGGNQGVGTVFKMGKDGTGYKLLHSFTSGLVNPFAGLYEGSDGALYGTGAGGEAGGVFKLNKDGSNYRVLASGLSFSQLVKGRDGALYGTIYGGNFIAGGNVFRINEDGSAYKVLHTFNNGGTGGREPAAGLILGKDGWFYGTTIDGGQFGVGTVFRLLVNRAPVAQCTNVIVSADDMCMAAASVDNGSFDPDGDTITLGQTPPGPYPLGTNLVTLTVTDNNGASNSCVASVVVIDTTPPNVSCPSNLVVEFSSDGGAVVNFSPVPVDNCDPSPSLVSLPPSGSTFPIGLTEVNCSATDASSNSSMCSFTVTVVGARGVKQDVLAELTALRGTLGCPGDGDICGKLDDAIQHLGASLQVGLWIDETHVERNLGKQVFQEEKNAAKKLCQLLKKTGLPGLDGMIERVTRADRLLASVAIQEAVVAGASTKKIQHAQSFLARGDSRVAGDVCGAGIEDYENAWKFAVRPQIASPVALARGSMQMEILSAPGDRIVIQASSNLLDWVTIGSGTTDGEGSAFFEDVDAIGHPVRYYRCFSQ